MDEEGKGWMYFPESGNLLDLTWFGWGGENVDMGYGMWNMKDGVPYFLFTFSCTS